MSNKHKYIKTIKLSINISYINKLLKVFQMTWIFLINFILRSSFFFINTLKYQTLDYLKIQNFINIVHNFVSPKILNNNIKNKLNECWKYNNRIKTTSNICIK